MATAKTAGARRGTGQRPLPPITVAKLEETGRLIERLVAENQSLFIEKGNAYRQAHREGGGRPLSAVESAQIAVAIAGELDPVEVTSSVLERGWRAYDEPGVREILLAAGVATAPAFLTAARLIVALAEMPSEEFEQARENDTLAEAIEARAVELQKLELSEGRKRASAAFAHYAKSAGVEVGEVWRLPVQAVWQALSEAAEHLTAGSPSSQLIDSAASTEDLPDPTSSTDSRGQRPLS